MTSVHVEDRQVVRAAGVSSVRIAAAAGVVYFGLIIAFSQMTSGSPSGTDPGRDVVDYLAQHHGRIQLAAVALGFAMPAALLWLSGLFRALTKAEGTPGFALAALGGGVLAATGGVTGALIAGTTATRFAQLGPASARVWWTMLLLSFGATLLGLLLLIGATAVVCLERHLFARWFAVASVVLAFVSAVGACAIGYDTSAIQVVAGVGLLLDSVWILLVSIFLWRDPALALPPGD